jgi:hypothetical protein
VVYNEESLDKWVEEMYNAIQEALSASAIKHGHCADQKPTLSSGIRDEIRLKIGQRGSDKTRDSAMKDRVNRLHRSMTFG